MKIVAVAALYQKLTTDLDRLHQLNQKVLQLMPGATIN